MATTNRGKGECRCGWNDHLCVCSILKPLQGEDTVQRSLPSAASVNSFDFDFDNAALEKEMMPSDDKSPKKKKNSEDLLLTSDYSRYDLMASVEDRKYQKEAGDNKRSDSVSEVEDQMSPTERKRIKEKKRREGMKKGFQELARLIFLIDPDLKERATSRKKSMGMRLPPSADESQLLDRVDLIDIAVTTLARVYKDNEVHKMLISHLAREAVEENQGESDGTSPEPLDNTLCLPDEIVSALTPDEAEGAATTKDKADQDSHELSQSEIKRIREKKRRNDINKGLDKMMQMILVIDPLLKAMLEERAETLHAAGSTSNTKDGQLLGRVELLSRVVGALSRIHSENEIHKVIIAKLARARHDEPQSSGDTPNVVSSSLANSAASKSPTRVSLLDNNAEASQCDNTTEAFQQASCDSSVESGETVMDGEGHEEDGRATKRFKT